MVHSNKEVDILKLVTLNKLNRLWKNGVLGKMIAKTKVLTTLTQVSANTNAENIAGATAVKELYNNLNARPQWITDSTGKITGYKTKGGADTVFPFSSGSKLVYKGVNVGNDGNFISGNGIDGSANRVPANNTKTSVNLSGYTHIFLIGGAYHGDINICNFAFLCKNNAVNDININGSKISIAFDNNGFTITSGGGVYNGNIRLMYGLKISGLDSLPPAKWG